MSLQNYLYYCLRDKQEVSSLKKNILKYSWLSTWSPLFTELKSNFLLDIYYNIKILLLGTISTGTRKKIRQGLHKVKFLKAGIKKHNTATENILRPHFLPGLVNSNSWDVFSNKWWVKCSHWLLNVVYNQLKREGNKL